MALDSLESSVKIAILRPNPCISVFFGHEASNVKNQLPSFEFSGHYTHYGGNMIACVQDIDIFAPHYSRDGPGAHRHVVNRGRQRRPLMIFQVMPGDAFGVQGGALLGKLLRSPGLAEARLKSQQAYLNLLGY